MVVVRKLKVAGCHAIISSVSAVYTGSQSTLPRLTASGPVTVSKTPDSTPTTTVPCTQLQHKVRNSQPGCKFYSNKDNSATTAFLSIHSLSSSLLESPESISGRGPSLSLLMSFTRVVLCSKATLVVAGTANLKRLLGGGSTGDEARVAASFG